MSISPLAFGIYVSWRWFISAGIGNFEQVAIRITKVERHERLCGTSPLYWSQKEGNMA
jgi:hypothetical protein